MDLKSFERFEVDGHRYLLPLPPEPMPQARWRTIRETYKQIYALELMVSQECNMECAYCYGTGNFGGSGLMSTETALRSIDWLFAAGAAKDILVSFYGGEPLLNFPVIQKTVEYCQTLFQPGEIQFSITTNLSLLTDEMLDFFTRPDVRLCVSFDGRAQRANRRYKDGRDSYDDVTKKIKNVLRKKPDALGRATLYGDYSRLELYKDLQEAGFAKAQVIAASGQLLKNRPFLDQADAYRMKRKEYPELTRRYLASVKNRDFKEVLEILIDSDFREQIGFGWMPRHNMMYCGGGRNLFAVDAEGSIYPCHRFVGNKEMELGTIHEPFDQLKNEIFDSHVTMENPSCNTCFLRFFCGGSCLYEAYCDAGAPSEGKSVFRPFEDFCAQRRQAAKLGIHVWHMLDDDDKKWLRACIGKG